MLVESPVVAVAFKRTTSNGGNVSRQRLAESFSFRVKIVRGWLNLQWSAGANRYDNSVYNVQIEHIKTKFIADNTSEH